MGARTLQQTSHGSWQMCDVAFLSMVCGACGKLGRGGQYLPPTAAAACSAGDMYSSWEVIPMQTRGMCPGESSTHTSGLRGEKRGAEALGCFEDVEMPLAPSLPQLVKDGLGYFSLGSKWCGETGRDGRLPPILDKNTDQWLRHAWVTPQCM